MDSKTYIENATRTESVIPKVEFGLVSLHALLGMCIHAAELIDLAKKNIYYGKAIDMEKWGAHAVVVASISAALLKMSAQDDVVNDDPEVKTAFGSFYPNANLGNLNTRLLHAAIGMTTESAEILKAVKAQFEGEMLDSVNVAEEIGDLEWYKAIALDELGADEAAIRERNIAKLKARFPNKFEAERAINRDLKTERAILEGNA